MSCGECIFWRPGAPLHSMLWAPEGSSSDVGVCELDPPTVVVANHAAISVQPVTHRSRSCGAFAPAGEGGGPDDGETIDLQKFREQRAARAKEAA